MISLFLPILAIFSSAAKAMEFDTPIFEMDDFNNEKGTKFVRKRILKGFLKEENILDMEEELFW